MDLFHTFSLPPPPLSGKTMEHFFLAQFLGCFLTFFSDKRRDTLTNTSNYIYRLEFRLPTGSEILLTGYIFFYFFLRNYVFFAYGITLCPQLSRVRNYVVCGNTLCAELHTHTHSVQSHHTASASDDVFGNTVGVAAVIGH